MDGDIIVLKIPRSIKGRWVMAARRKQQRVAAWIVEAVEASLSGPALPRWQHTGAYAQLFGEALAVIKIGTTKELKERWLELARADHRRLSDWVVCHVESQTLKNSSEQENPPI